MDSPLPLLAGGTGAAGGVSTFVIGGSAGLGGWGLVAGNGWQTGGGEIVSEGGTGGAPLLAGDSVGAGGAAAGATG